MASVGRLLFPRSSRALSDARMVSEDTVAWRGLTTTLVHFPTVMWWCDSFKIGWDSCTKVGFLSCENE
jgi:hypothetical protein